jgi:hypothetical protein
MPFVRLIIPFGLMFFGAAAAFLGGVVLINSLGKGTISYSYGSGAGQVTTTVARDADPNGYWTTLGWMGLLPLAGGLVAVQAGRRMLRR